MKIGIIVAMGKELSLLLPLLKDSGEPAEINGFTFHCGTIGSHQIVAMQCGIGKVNAAVGTITLINNFAPELIINTGVAGGSDPSMHVLDKLVATDIAYHDVWCGPETEFGAAAGLGVFMKCNPEVVAIARRVASSDPKLKFGLLCSGDRFICKPEEVAEIKKHFPLALAVDMESGAIAQVCLLNGVPFNVVRVISDTPGQKENISQYEQFWSDAPVETFSMLTEILNSL